MLNVYERLITKIADSERDSWWWEEKLAWEQDCGELLPSVPGQWGLWG